MDPKILEIFAITVPVFSLAGVGKFLSVKKVLTKENRAPLSWITYYLALPSLIFSSFLKKESGNMEITAMLTMSLLPILVLSLLFAVILFKSRKDEKFFATIFTSYWGNNGYMGIPLSISALGAVGLPLAAVVNGLSVPFYIGISLLMMIHVTDHGKSKHAILKEFLHTLFNPVILAMIFGAILSTVKPHVSASIKSDDIIRTVFETLLATLTHLGHMGLPLALLLVGSNLKIEEIKSDKLLIALSAFGKLVLAPALVYFFAPILFPDISKATFQALVLLNAVPGAVASFIISEKFNCAEDFVSSTLVITTLLSVITIPLWLHIIL